MKTTIELPDPLMRRVKLRALNEGRKLKEVVADLLDRGLNAPDPPQSTGKRSFLSQEQRSGLPVIRCQHPAAGGQRLTPERVADILVEQEASWQNEAGR